MTSIKYRPAVSAQLGLGITLALIGSLLWAQGIAIIATLFLVIGVVVAALGLYSIVAFFKRREKKLLPLIIGLVELAVGTLLAIFRGSFVTASFLVIGILLIVLGILNLIPALSRKNAIFVILIAILQLAIGILFVVGFFLRDNSIYNDFVRSVGIITTVIGGVMIVLAD